MQRLKHYSFIFLINYIVLLIFFTIVINFMLIKYGYFNFDACTLRFVPGLFQLPMFLVVTTFMNLIPSFLYSYFCKKTYGSFMQYFILLLRSIGTWILVRFILELLIYQQYNFASTFISYTHTFFVVACTMITIIYYDKENNKEWK